MTDHDRAAGQPQWPHEHVQWPGSQGQAGDRAREHPPPALAGGQADAQAAAQAYGYPAPQAYGYGVQMGYPQWQPAVPPASNGIATAGMVLGITAVVFCWWGLFTLAQVVLAITFGAIGLSRANNSGGTNRGQAIAGIVLGVIAFFAYVVIGIVTLGIGLLI